MPTCRKCGHDFPNRVVLDGKEHSLGKRKFCLDCSPFGTHNTRKLDQPPKREITFSEVRTCGICGRSYTYKNGGSPSKCPSCNSNLRRFALKIKAIDYKGGKCVVCGYSRCVGALCFHHRDPNEKEFTISGNHCRRWDVLKQELDKCVLLCTNCHAELHSGMISLP